MGTLSVLLHAVCERHGQKLWPRSPAGSSGRSVQVFLILTLGFLFLKDQSYSVTLCNPPRIPSQSYKGSGAMDPEIVSNFLSEQRENTPEDLQASFLQIEDFWDRKLWHQLTDVLVKYFHDPASSSQQLALFRHFILSFSEKINQLKFVSLGLLAASQCAGEHSFP